MKYAEIRAIEYYMKSILYLQLIYLCLQSQEAVVHEPSGYVHL